MWELIYQVGKVMPVYENVFGSKGPGLSEDEIKRRNESVRGLTLYQFQLSPFCKRVRNCTAQLGVTLESRDILADQKIDDELIAGGGKDIVPCLKIEEPGAPVRWLYESLDIVSYLKNRVGVSS